MAETSLIHRKMALLWGYPLKKSIDPVLTNSEFMMTHHQNLEMTHWPETFFVSFIKERFAKNINIAYKI